jgi:hypothetical protein
VRQRTESSNTGARSSGSSKTMEELRMLAAASAFISDVPLVMLKMLVKELNDRNMAIVSEKKLREKTLKEIKQEARPGAPDEAGSNDSIGSCSQDSRVVGINAPIWRPERAYEQV